MDLQMPVMDGYETIRQIRVQPALAGLPVYALSAHSGRNVLERCLALGMNGCLNKPYELSELYAVLRQHYSGRGHSGLLPLLPVGSKALPGQDGIPGLTPYVRSTIPVSVRRSIPACSPSFARVCRRSAGLADRRGGARLGTGWCPSPIPSRGAPVCSA